MHSGASLGGAGDLRPQGPCGSVLLGLLPSLRGRSWVNTGLGGKGDSGQHLLRTCAEPVPLGGWRHVGESDTRTSVPSCALTTPCILGSRAGMAKNVKAVRGGPAPATGTTKGARSPLAAFSEAPRALSRGPPCPGCSGTAGRKGGWGSWAGHAGGHPVRVSPSP